MLTRLAASVALLLTVSCGATTYTARTFAANLNFLRTSPDFLSPPHISGDSHAQWLLPLVKLAAAHGVRVTIREFPIDAWGLYSPTYQFIAINRELSLNAQVATLAHELAHVLEPAELTRFQSDVFAESVAVLVMGQLGLNTTLASASYFLFNSTTDVAAEVRRQAPEIDRTVAYILKELHAHR